MSPKRSLVELEGTNKMVAEVEHELLEVETAVREAEEGRRREAARAAAAGEVVSRRNVSSKSSVWCV